MEIRRWHCYIVINCALIIPYLVAKPFSLNKAIAAESRQKVLLETTVRPKLIETTAERFSLNKALNPASLKPRKIKATGSIINRSKISPLKYRKTYQIKSPLKPKKLKYKQKPRYKRKNKSLKREINEDVQFNKKYIPLLKSFGMLFDNLLSADSSESVEVDRSKDTRNRYLSEERKGIVCSCTHKSDSEVAESKPSKETATIPAPVDVTTPLEAFEIETPAPTTDNTPTSDFSSLRQDTDVPLLPARDTSSGRGDHNGLSEGSSPTFHRSTEGNITGDHRNSEYNAGSEQNESCPRDNEENPYGTPRDGASNDEQRGPGGNRRGICGDRIDTESPVYRGTIEETNQLPKGEDSNEHFGGSVNEFERENKLETDGDQTKGGKSVQEPIRGYRRFVPADKVGINTEPKEVDKESIDNDAHSVAGDKRFVDRNGTFAAEDQKASPTNEAITIQDFSYPFFVVEGSPQNKAPTVTIIDGYSVARDKNGQNKLAEKSIRVHS